MKKLFALIIGGIICLSVTACSQDSQTQDTMVVKPSEFSKETTSILELFSEEIMFFDFIVDETIKSSTINVWVYENGEWIAIGETQANIDKADNQIAIKMTEDSYELFTIDETGYVKYSSPKIDIGFEDTKQQISNKINSHTNILIGEEIPLWVKIGNNGNSIRLPDDFRNSDCTQGVAVTVTFSDNGIE